MFPLSQPWFLIGQFCVVCPWVGCGRQLQMTMVPLPHLQCINARHVCRTTRCNLTGIYWQQPCVSICFCHAIVTIQSVRMRFEINNFGNHSAQRHCVCPVSFVSFAALAVCSSAQFPIFSMVRLSLVRRLLYGY